MWLGILKFVGFGTFLELFVLPLAKRVLVGLGIGVISFAGATVIFGQLASLIQSSLSGMAADVYAIVALGGFIDAIGIWLGALTTVAGLLAFRKLGLLQ